MHLLMDVDSRDVSPVLWLFLGAIAAQHRAETGVELTVTSLRRPPATRFSWHSPPGESQVRAADLRRWTLDAHHIADPFARRIQERWGQWLGVVLEPEWLLPQEIIERGGAAAIKGHIHVQLKLTSWPLVL